MDLLSAGTQSNNAKSTAGTDQTVAQVGLFAIVVNMGAGGAAGAGDDIDVFAGAGAFNKAGGVARKNFLILDAFADVETNVALSTLQFRSAPAGGGTARTLSISSANAGRAREATGAFQSSDDRIVGADEKLFLARSDRSVTGRVTLLCAALG